MTYYFVIALITYIVGLILIKREDGYVNVEDIIMCAISSVFWLPLGLLMGMIFLDRFDFSSHFDKILDKKVF